MLKAMTIVAAGVLVAGGTAFAVASHGGTHTNAALNSVQMSTNSKTSSGNSKTPALWAGHKGFIGRGVMLQDVAKTLNVSPATLRTDLKDGQSLAQIAQAHSVSAASLENTLSAQAKTQIQDAVSSGKMTQTDASAIEAHLGTMVDTMVMQTPAVMKDGQMMFKEFMTDAATSLHLSTSTLKTDLSAGQSLAAIAQAHSSSATALETALTADAKGQIQNAVSSGHLTSTEAATLESHLSPIIDNMVTNQGDMMHGAWGHGRPFAMKGLMTNVSRSLNISNSTLRTDLKDGQSLATIAKDHGSSASALESNLVADAKVQMPKGVALLEGRFLHHIL
jgi:lambda repressor-like predicted transcriptional regulator